MTETKSIYDQIIDSFVENYSPRDLTKMLLERMEAPEVLKELQDFQAIKEAKE